MKTNESAFTIIELLIVTVLLSFVSLTVFVTFNKGAIIWQRVTRYQPKEDILIFFTQLDKDLRNSFNFTSIPFTAGPESMSFASLVKSSRLNKLTVGKVFYYYDSSRHSLNRLAHDYADYNADRDRGLALGIKTLEEVSSLKLSYYTYNPESDEYTWKKEWSMKELPLSVKIEAEININDTPLNIARIVDLPLGK
ncbi:MAG: type II secretion system protein [Candidatus Omnitrophota bacterium]